MPDELDRRYLPALRNALLLLSLPPSEQLKKSAPACVACDLLDEFEICCQDVLENLPLEDEQSKRLYELLNIVGDMKKADIECFNPQVLGRPVWQTLREKSHGALIAMGWQDDSVEPFTEVEPGVWLRQRSDT